MEVVVEEERVSAVRVCFPVERRAEAMTLPTLPVTCLRRIIKLVKRRR